jgi:uncharacterized membrane protein YdbT with pleckstrin-like domain
LKYSLLFIIYLNFEKDNMVNNEQTIWEGSSSQVLNLSTYFSCLLIIIILGVVGSAFNPLAYWLISIVVVYAIWSYLTISSQHYKLTNERIILQRGILNRVTDELELYRVKDHRLEQPLFLRMLGLGNIILITSDQLNHEVYMVALKDSQKLREDIRRLVEERRRTRGVRELDTN